MKYISLESNFWERQAHSQNVKALPSRKPRVNYSVVAAQKRERKETGDMLKEQRRQRAQAKAVNRRKKRKEEKEERKRKEEIERKVGRAAFLTTGRNIYRELSKLKDDISPTKNESYRLRPVLWSHCPVTADPLPRLEWATRLKETALKCMKYGYGFGASRDLHKYAKFMKKYNGVRGLIERGIK